MKEMNLVCYGGGTNSTALLIECMKRGIKVDLVLFADTGGEKPQTYNYVSIFNEWLINNGMPGITTVQAVNKAGEKITLEESLIKLCTLPSVAYGFKTCSQRFKIAPQDKFLNNHPAVLDHWKAGGKVTKLIGYDAGESHRTKKDHTDDKYDFDYPLVRWGMGREECVKTITDAGLCLPGKSSCYFCPNSRPSEIKQLSVVYPELMERALAMEANANLTHIKGLGRSYAWKDLVSNDDMFKDQYQFTPEMSCDCYDGEPE